MPLDRKHPRQTQLHIYFELYVHSGSGRAESAILANFGGIGLSTTVANRDFALFLFGPNLDVHDLLLVDDRGRGLSGALDCSELQHGTAPFTKALADCAAQLGNASSRYGSGDVGQDTEAVRAALGYDKVDYFGASYGGADISAYATRFGQHLRSVVLDSPFGAPGTERFGFEKYRTDAEPKMVLLDCSRSPACAADHPDPVADLDSLISAIRIQPVDGDAHDASGNLVHVRIDEKVLLNYIIDNPTGAFTSTGEIPAAAGALRGGDPAPLLRLGAEGMFPLVGDYGDPTFFSISALYAAFCVDVRQPWDWSSPVSERELQYAHAVAALPQDEFAPFSKSAVSGLVFSWSKRCLNWEKPTPSSPMVPLHAVYPNVPTLVLGGDLDNLVPLDENSKVAALFPGSTEVTVEEAGHRTVFWSQCAQSLASEFIATLQVGDASCASTPETVWPALGRFAFLAKDARPAKVDPDGQNQIGVNERKVVTVALAAATDAMQRSLFGSGDGVGLRAGSFHTDYGDTAWTTTLTSCAFANDVIATGSVTWGAGISDFSFVADLKVSGNGSKGGNLHVEGAWQAPGLVGQFKVSGVLGGRKVAVLVPEG